MKRPRNGSATLTPVTHNSFSVFKVYRLDLLTASFCLMMVASNPELLNFPSMPSCFSVRRRCPPGVCHSTMQTVDLYYMKTRRSFVVKFLPSSRRPRPSRLPSSRLLPLRGWILDYPIWPSSSSSRVVVECLRPQRFGGGSFRFWWILISGQYLTENTLKLAF